MTRTIESESTNRIDRKRAKIVFVASFVATVLSEEQDLLCEDRRHDVISNGTFIWVTSGVSPGAHSVYFVYRISSEDC